MLEIAESSSIRNSQRSMRSVDVSALKCGHLFQRRYRTVQCQRQATIHRQIICQFRRLKTFVCSSHFAQLLVDGLTRICRFAASDGQCVEAGDVSGAISPALITSSISAPTATAQNTTANGFIETCLCAGLYHSRTIRMLDLPLRRIKRDPTA